MPVTPSPAASSAPEPDPIGEAVQRLSRAGASAVAGGLVIASGGNLSARIDADRFLVTASGSWLDRLTPADFVLLGLDGERLGGAGARPSVEWRLHALSYRARPDVRAIVHLHPQYALLVSMLGQPIRRTTLDHSHYLPQIAEVGFAPAGSVELATSAAAACAGGCDAVVLAHHGCSALGDSVEMALRRAQNLEQAAEMTYRLLLAGDNDTTFPTEYVGREVVPEYDA